MVHSRWVFSSKFLDMSVPGGFSVVASSTLRPLTHLAPDPGSYEELVHQHTCPLCSLGSTCGEAQGGFVFAGND